MIKKYQLEQLREYASQSLNEPWAKLAIQTVDDLQTARDTVASIIESRVLMDSHIPLTWDERTVIHHKLIPLIIGTNTRP